MSNSIRQVGTMAMDMYYKSYRPADAFLRIEHFMFLCIAADSKIKLDEYNQQVLLNLRKRNYNAPVTLSTDNYITEKDIPVTGDKVKLKNKIMSYPGAGYVGSVSEFKPDNSCGVMMPIAADEKWQVCNEGSVVFYSPNGDEIDIINNTGCKFDKVTVTYIPQLDNNSGEVNTNRSFLILNMVSALIKGATEGVLVDMSNDMNPNAHLQTELNSHLLNKK